MGQLFLALVQGLFVAPILLVSYSLGGMIGLIIAISFCIGGMQSNIAKLIIWKKESERNVTP